MWGKILTVRASYDFECSSKKKQRPPRCNPLVLSRLVLSLLYARVLSRTGARWSAVVLLLLVGGCCGCQDGGEVVRGGAAAARRWLLWMSGRGRGGPRWCAVKNINILQKSYIKIWLYNVFVVHLHRVNKTNV